MKKLLFVCIALVLVAGFAAPGAEAQTCLKFDAFCDGIQVDSISGNNIAASWYNYDCANTWPGMKGKKGQSIPNLCPGGNGNAGIVARSVDGSPTGDWTFVIDSLDGTFDMNLGVAPTDCWIDELAYTMSMGVCTGKGGDAAAASTD